jgi:hypothetical protein
MATSLIASPRKLPNGQWGAYCAAAKVGDVVTVRTAAGKEWQARVVEITDSGTCITSSTGHARTDANGFTISRPAARSTSATRTGCRCGSVEEYSKPSDCWTCKHDS